MSMEMGLPVLKRYQCHLPLQNTMRSHAETPKRAQETPNSWHALNVHPSCCGVNTTLPLPA